MKLIESKNYCSATAIYVKSPAGKRRAAMFMAINNREIGLCLWISGLCGHSRVPNQRQQTGQSASWRDPITSIWPWFAMNLIRINQVETLIQLHIPFQDHESFIHVHQQNNAKIESITMKPGLWFPQDELWRLSAAAPVASINWPSLWNLTPHDAVVFNRKGRSVAGLHRSVWNLLDSIRF
jgi:hypothetical protein